jgi:hypothetical protein
MFGKLKLGLPWRFVGFPQAVMNMWTPKQSIERRDQIVMAADEVPFDAGAT